MKQLYKTLPISLPDVYPYVGTFRKTPPLNVDILLDVTALFIGPKETQGVEQD